ncbi:uncharacterized protein LY89DRAFT_686256 [Mollisia scopiformis]|uniref:Uncharacterized protein n=1 Tax=Mollisia scopiformis TaxID=149040 RepID=A0A194X6T9_MOLSC|nr:uncharacterized protein LY89DRAFT_686256 [Mollisia scopiformis]KUJ15522.1 hypothetical protein LY89DRAFT_686256 [Mollisia scopiformis]
MADMQNMQPVRMANIPNSPERSPILRIALEPREVIYSYLLIYPKPIIVKHDWEIVERNPFVDHSIILVCKQFATEASAFLYRNNTFQALLRVTTGQFRRFEVPTTIAPSHHANFRNLIINCSPDCWNMDWHEKTAKGLMTLVSAKAVIKSLTLVVSPKRVGMSTTALGDENTPITFADFLWYHGPLMTAIRRLAPQVLKIIVTKSGTNRFGMEVNTSYVQAGLLEEGPLANEETVRMRKLNVQSVEGELMTLKMRLEQIYEDDQLAALEGVCTPLIDEKVANRATPPTTVPSHGRRK